MRNSINSIFLLIPWIIFASHQEEELLFFKHLKSLEFDEAINISKKIDDDKLSSEFHLLAEVLYFEGQKELSYFLKKIDQQDDKVIAENELGVVINLKLGYLDLFYNRANGNAYKYFYQAYTIANYLNKSYLRKACLLAFMKYYNYEIAQNSEAYKPYLEEFTKIIDDNIDEVWATIYQLIFYSKTLNEFNEHYFQFADKLEQFEHQLRKDNPLLANIFYEKALMLDLNGDTDEASEYYQKANLGAGSYPFLKSVKFFALIKLAMIAVKRKNFVEAETFLKSAKEHLNKADTLRSNYYLHLNKSFLYRAQEDRNIAFDFLLSAYRKDFELDFRTNTLEVTRLNVELETQKKEKQILKEQQRAETNRNWLIAAILALFLGSGIAILIQKNTAKKRLLAEQEVQLKQQRVENLLKEQELVSIDAMIEGQEKERQKVAGELHDDLGSLMATIKLHFDNAKVSTQDPALKNAQKLLEEAYQKIRGMAHSKNSGVMSDQGLLPAIKKMAKSISESNTLQVSVEDFGLGERMENSLELSIFRMVQELVANAIKHANATKVNIQLTQHEDNLNIIVEDNGKGFDRSKLDKVNSGMGLTNIEKRVEHLEGSFTVDSVLGKGTSILIDIPV
ncbi:tetratricopeptide repeat-containing sensor histidine kinase [Flagellimonas aequoris]|uniref:Oxygen sensor histidine kinase NreB n=1 Tax=Flagellimonas aequoris TaxID=2306997 RepID=A0A418N9R0_9FLAO|nr:sensor histidine kinase [Allomuricauda aequoris]RIV72106.1 sensor histidine kinase [Allomuricauda aequoris]TXK03879.1 sensor histidine kinase [Allomuricauda aequoris]